MNVNAYARDLEKAIRGKCIDCCGYSRTLVRECNMKYCPLWPYRNNSAGSSTAKEKATVASCPEGQMNLFEEMRA